MKAVRTALYTDRHIRVGGRYPLTITWSKGNKNYGINR